MYRVDESNIDEGFIRSVSMAKFEKGVGWLLTMLTPVFLLDPVLLFQIVGNINLDGSPRKYDPKYALKKLTC